MSVPLHRIPKIRARCIVCESDSTTIVMSKAQADGYMRRHFCNECDAPFYTLAKYDQTGYQIQARPFKDRALTEWERIERLEWMAEAEKVTVHGNGVFYSRFIEDINTVFGRQRRGEKLSERDVHLIEAINQLEDEYHNGDENEQTLAGGTESSGDEGEECGFEGEHGG